MSKANGNNGEHKELTYNDLVSQLNSISSMAQVARGPALRDTVWTREIMLRERIKYDLKLSAIERGVSDADEFTTNYYRYHQALLQKRVDELTKDVDSMARHWPIISAMTELRGVSTTSAAKIVCEIDIARSNTISALWRYAGYAVVDGKRERRVKGEKSHYNEHLKRAVYQQGDLFIKLRNPYRDLYDTAKERYTALGWTKMHAHLASIAPMVKMFLSHLWLVWREMEGLPLSLPYAHGILGHPDYRTPQQYGWPVATEEKQPVKTERAISIENPILV